MKLLDRYILRETCTPMLIGLIALTFASFSREIGTLFDIIVRRSVTLQELLALASAILPSVLTFTLPMALLVGILTGFGRMSSDSEAIALRATGVSMRRILRPVMILAFTVWAVNIGLTTWVAPGAAGRLRALTHEIAAREGSIEIQPRVFNESIPNIVLYVHDAAPEESRWNGIMLGDMTNPNDPLVIFAESGELAAAPDGRQLQLSNGNTHIVSPTTPNRYASSTFERMTIPIPIPPPPAAPRDPAASEIATAQLWQTVRAGSASFEEQVEFHRRIALPFACLAFALVALPLGVSTARGSKSMGLVLSLLLMLTYYLAFAGGTRIAMDANFPPVLGAWLPNITFAVLGLFLLFRSDRQYEDRGLGRLQAALHNAARRAASVRLHSKPRNPAQPARPVGLPTRHSKFFRLLDLYVLRGFWFFFVVVLVVFVALFNLITLFELLPDIVKNQTATSTVLNYFLYLFPQILYWIMPLTVLLAILINLGTLTKGNEVLAVKAGAISLYRLALPLFGMGLLLSAALYFMQDFMLPYTNQKQDEYRNIIKGRATQTYRDPYRKWMAGTNDRIYHYGYFDPAENLFGGLSVFTFEPGTFRLTEWVFAERGSWNGTSWTFENGWTRRFLPGNVENYSRFAALDVTGIDAPEHFKKEVRTAAQMTYLELRSYVDDLRGSGFDVTGLTLDLYRKLSFPIVTLIMAIIGVPFSFKTGRKGAFYGIGFCIIVGIVYWSTFELFDKLGGIHRLPPLMAAWFPNLIFGTAGFWMLLRVRT